MKKNFLYFLFVVMACHMPFESNAQIRVSGIIKDAESGERLIGATITSGAHGTTSDNNGYFSWFITSPDSILISFMGYTPVQFFVVRDTIIEVSLVAGHDLSEVVVAENRFTVSNIARLNNTELQSIPSISGKPDVMKAIQLLPGIQSQTEGSSLLLVRGGNPGENMYLFDNVPVIYVNHLGGLLSVFNPDIINSMDVFKGNFPSRYGGKLSSIVNIVQKEGDRSKLKGSLHLGLTDLSMTVEGPVKENTSFIFTARKTLFDYLFMSPLFSSGSNATVMLYGFHDFNGKISFKPNVRNSFHLNLYQGDDYLMRRNKKDIDKPENRYKMNYTWGNWLASGGWKYMISPRLFADNSIAYSRYRLKENYKFSFKNNNTIEDHHTDFISYVQMISAMSDWKFQAHNKWNIGFGINSNITWSLPNYSYQTFPPKETDFSAVTANETAAYIENHIDLPLGLKIVAGARGVNYVTSGFSATRFEPRLSLYKQISPMHEINAGYMEVNQFSHLLFTSGSIMNNEVWVPADESIKPSASRQISMGWTGKFLNGVYQTELNLYHKTLNNLATYREGFVNLKGDEHWKTKIETGGKGEAYGLELLLRKNKGAWTGFAGYTWSRAIRQFEGINNGREYRFDFDRPHAFSLSLSHHFNRRISLNIAWVYQTGLPYTPVLGRHLLPSLDYTNEDGSYYFYEAFIYGERNSANMRSYHRLDVSVSFNNYTPDNYLQSAWTFGLYNAYNRKNPLYYYYNTSSNIDYQEPQYTDNGYLPLNVYQYSMFPVIPTISYKYYFEKGRRANLKSTQATNHPSYIKNRWNVKLNGRKGSYAFPPNPPISKYMEAEVNYGFFKYLEAGVLIGAEETKHFFKRESDKALLYGLNTNIHLLPLLIKREKYWLDLYLAGKLGGRYFTASNLDEKYTWTQFYGAGIAIYPYKFIGLFAEYGMESRTDTPVQDAQIEIEPYSPTRLRYGISIKF